MKRPGALRRHKGLRSSASSTRSGDTGQGGKTAQRRSWTPKRTDTGPTPEARGLVRHQPMRKQSAKRAAIAPARRELRLRLLDERPWCEARTPQCGGRAVDCHERLRRSQGGDILDETDIITVCRACHDWIGHNPAAAERLGLARWRWRAPSNPAGGAA